ncbi:hypothetical protein C2855_04225 [Aeromonas bestiarum]|nr:hypothetical protein C2855_04225 [Aeromonas bestiarum]
MSQFATAGVEWGSNASEPAMSRYHFFKQGQSFTYLDTWAVGYDDERLQLVEQGFVTVVAPSFADTPAEALTLLQDHEALEEERRVHNPWYTVAGIFGLLGMS